MAVKEYGNAGTIGVLTPQANTTVEPELWALLPAHWSMLNARLTSSLDSIEARLVDYTGKFNVTSGQFANAPIDVIAAACTGASYLIGAEAEARLVDEVQSSHGKPFLTAALASVAALRLMGAKKIALLTPYPESLNRHSTPYWESFGFEVVAKTGPALETDAFHPIYAMTGNGVLAAYRELSASGADAVLMLGTGMATLYPMLAGHAEGLIPAISCNVALVWAAVQARDWQSLGATDLPDWLSGERWQERLKLMYPPA
jgi:maleate isomerase